MQPVTDEGTAPSDAELISRVRAGDRSAFGDLYGRHARAAATMARQISVSGAESDDLVAESFARVLDTLLDGRGPDSSFRAYLFTTIRHTAYDRTRKDRRLHFTDDVAAHEVATEADDPVLMRMENSFVAKAFGQLPERWQTVLWHTQVEGQSAAEVGVLLGMSPNAVSSLAFRAREGLREAYLQVHMSETVADRCRDTIDRLGAWTRGGLSKREKAQVDAHLAECDRCPALAAELSEINSGLRGLLAPLLLGSAAAGYIATLPAVPVLAQVGAHVAGVGTASSGFVTVLGKARHVAKQPAALAAGVAAAAAAAVVALVIALTGNTESPGDSNLAEQATTVVTGGAGTNGAGGSDQGGADQGGAGAGDSGEGGSGSTDGAGNESAGGSGAAGSNGTGGTADATGTGGSNTADATNGSSGNNTSGTNGTNPLNPNLPTLPPGTGQSTGPSTTSASATPAPSNNGPISNPPVNTSQVSSPPVSTPPTTDSPVASTPVDPPTDPSVPTDPPTEPPTDPPLTEADLQVVAPTLPITLAAGATATVRTTVTNGGETASTDDQLITFTGPFGFSLVSATASGPAALRSSGSAIRAAAPDSDLCATGPCRMPIVEPGATLTLTLVIQITPDAAPGEMVLTIAGKSFPSTVAVQPGYQSVTLIPQTGVIPAGSNSELTLIATTSPDTTNPGPLSFPTSIGTGVLITLALDDACSILAGTVTCTPDATGQLGSVRFQTVVLPQATSGNVDVTIDLPGGPDHDLRVTLVLAVTPVPPNGPIEMTGPFGGTSVGAAIMECTDKDASSRGACGPNNTSMKLVSPEPAQVRPPEEGQTIVFAALVWAATDESLPSAANPTPDLSTVDLIVDGSISFVQGILVPQTNSKDATDLKVYSADVTSALAAGGGVSVSGLDAASENLGLGTPMGAWTLTVIWSDTTVRDMRTVEYRNSTERSVPPGSATGSTDTVAGITNGDTGVAGLWLTLWASDPWGSKALSYGGNTPITNLDGSRNVDPDRYQNGYDLVSFGPQSIGNGSGLVLTNKTLPGPGSTSINSQDGLWIGPMLLISEATN